MTNFKEMMKLFIKISKYCIFPVFIVVVLCRYIDQFDYFSPFDLHIGDESCNKNFIKTSYIIDNPNKFDSFILGNSRIGAIHTEKIDKEKCYNMTYPLGVPKENLNTIRTLIENNVEIKTIYLSVDSLSYTENYLEHEKEPMFAPYEFIIAHPIESIDMYYDFSITVRNIKEILLNGKEEKKEKNIIFYEYGWNEDYNEESEYPYSDVRIGECYYFYETIEDIKKIKELCNKNEIELIVFTSPMHYITYEGSLKVNYLGFLKELALVTDYINFSGYNNVTTKYENYRETSHYKAEVGDILIDAIWNNKVDEDLIKQGFGYNVNKDNVDEFIQILENERVRYINEHKN